jgi:hypothetical protein
MSDNKFSDIPYNEWQASFIAFLYSKDLEGYINLDPDDNKIKDSKHCYSYVPHLFGYRPHVAPKPAKRCHALICSGPTFQTRSLHLSVLAKPPCSKRCIALKLGKGRILFLICLG